MMPFIRTVTGDIAPQQLGITLLHEHLLTNPAASVTDRDLEMPDEAAALQELKHLHTAGGRAIVEMTPRDYGRMPEGLRRLSQASGVHIICITGWIKQAAYSTWADERSANDLASEMIHEVNDGIDDSGIRAGVIKAGSSLNKITALEETVFRAAAIAHRETGAPISTHTEAGTMGLEQVALLRAGGVPPESILIGHTDRNLDWAYHLALANTGVTLGYDQLGKEKYFPDSQRVEFILRLARAGFTGQLAISGDLARRSYFPAYGNWGGPGFTYVLWRFVPWLVSEGLDAASIDQMLIHTPARLLSIAR